MGKSTRRRRYYRKSGRWSSNIAEITDMNKVFITSEGDFNFYTQLVQNPPQSSNTVSQKYTIKNVEITVDIATSGGVTALIENLTAYIMYLPQGMTVTNDLIKNHPEYVMAYRYIGTPFSDSNLDRNPLRMKTRLARKLNTGDSIILFVKGISETDSAQEVQTNGIIRWWSKAN